MSYLKIKGMLTCAAFATLLFSCGGGEEKTTSETTTADTASLTPAAEANPAVNTIKTTPQHMVIIRHKVADFAKWMPGYEGHDTARLASGLHNYVIGRGVEDTSIVLVVLKADDIARAKAFSKEPSLRAAMQKGGVKGTPTVQFVTATWQDTLVLPNQVRSMTQYMVSDAATWRTGFENGEQEHKDNGISARVIGHDADNDKKIFLVTALADTAKANAYWKSDALKKRMEAGGVQGKPERFLFTVIKRY